MNNNRNDERAIQAGCKGVFSVSGFIGVGTKAKPEDYTKKQAEHPRFGGKQIGVQWPKVGRTVDTYFQKEHKQTKPSKGFLTSDYHRRDEFSLDFRTEQYREQLAMEEKFTKRALDQLKAQNPDTAETTGQLVSLVPQEGVDKPFLYDLVFDSAALTKDGASKVHRDTKNPTWHTKERKLGDMRTTMLIAHAPPHASCFVKPQFANKPLIRDTFYRRTNVNFPDDCAAVDVSES